MNRLRRIDWRAMLLLRQKYREEVLPFSFLVSSLLIPVALLIYPPGRRNPLELSRQQPPARNLGRTLQHPQWAGARSACSALSALPRAGPALPLPCCTSVTAWRRSIPRRCISIQRSGLSRVACSSCPAAGTDCCRHDLGADVAALRCRQRPVAALGLLDPNMAISGLVILDCAAGSSLP